MGILTGKQTPSSDSMSSSPTQRLGTTRRLRDFTVEPRVPTHLRPGHRATSSQSLGPECYSACARPSHTLDSPNDSPQASSGNNERGSYAHRHRPFPLENGTASESPGCRGSFLIHDLGTGFC